MARRRTETPLLPQPQIPRLFWDGMLFCPKSDSVASLDIPLVQGCLEYHMNALSGELEVHQAGGKGTLLLATALACCPNRSEHKFGTITQLLVHSAIRWVVKLECFTPGFGLQISLLHHVLKFVLFSRTWSARRLTRRPCLHILQRCRALWMRPQPHTQWRALEMATTA